MNSVQVYLISMQWNKIFTNNGIFVKTYQEILLPPCPSAHSHCHLQTWARKLYLDPLLRELLHQHLLHQLVWQLQLGIQKPLSACLVSLVQSPPKMKLYTLATDETCDLLNSCFLVTFRFKLNLFIVSCTESSCNLYQVL